jgi:hypothetical protein
MGVTKTPAGSPSAGDEEVDDVADQAAVTDPVSSTGTDDKATSSVESSDAVGDRDATKQPTALDALKAKLVKEPTDADPAEIADDVAEEPVAAEDADEVHGDVPHTEPEVLTLDAADPEDDPLHGFTEREVKHPSNKGMVTRIRDLAADRKKLKQQVQEIEPVKQAGEFLTKFQADNDLTPEESVAALALSAAFKRGDPRALESLEAATAQLRADLGVPDPVQAAPAPVEPFRGALSQEYADMVTVLGIPEADVRLMHALLSRHKTAPPPAAKPVAARPAPRPIARQPAPPDNAHNVKIATAANETVLDYLETQKVSKDKASEHIQKHLWKYLTPLAPGGDPARIPAEDRLRLVTIAQQKHILAVAKLRAAERAKNPQALSSTTSTAAAPNAQSSKPKSELDKLKARMVAKR